MFADSRHRERSLKENRSSANTGYCHRHTTAYYSRGKPKSIGFEFLCEMTSIPYTYKQGITVKYGGKERQTGLALTQTQKRT